ncbi:helix-turn-helix domain-containing protein [Streptomyces phytohabitans]|uniref:helix-turn-helix domain-containing protein n=1 Tax=Streptomyces phytohabitans TaxID=1150371 RepID=UPI00345B7775
MTEQPDETETMTARAVLAGELRRLRAQSGKSLAQLSDDTTYDRTYLHRLETGERISQRPVMEALEGVYETGGLLLRLWQLAQQEEEFAAFLDRYRAFMEHESRARIMYKFSAVIPGLLQTEDFASVVLGASGLTGTELDEQVAARISRQQLLYRTPAPTLRVLLEEEALRRPTQDPRVWRDQLANLLKAAEAPNIVLQVLPFSAGVHDLMGGSVSILWGPDGTAVVWLEGNKSGELVDEPGEVESLRISYDRVRDAALSPNQTTAFIESVMEDSQP